MEAVSGLDTRPELKTTPDGDVAVAVRGVHRSFGETKALRGVDFTARAGEIHAVVGENGSGKSTLSKIIAGILPADEGQVSVLGTPVTSVGSATKAGVSLVLQEVLVAEGRTIAENVLAGHGSLFRSTISRSERASRVRTLLEELIGERVDPAALVDTLPLAQRQWVTIARSLLRDPKVLVLDESTAALDLDGAKRLYEVAQLLRDGGACVLIVTHRIAELVAFADRATVLRDGQHVGTLEAADISEESLLALMSGPARAEAGAETASAARVLGPSRLTASGLRLKGAEGFTDLDIAEGEILGLAGLDGQGHTEFLRVLAGIAEAEGGTVEVDGPRGKGRIASLDDAERLGVAFVSGDRRRFGIFPNLSIFENFATHHYRAQARRGLIDRGAARGLFDAQRDQLKIRLGDPADPITSLSGGNQQKVLIGRSLAKEPSVIALDDPARGVDVGTKRDLYSELRRRAGAGATVIYLSSEIDELVGLCDRVAVFRSGSLLTCLTGADITGDAILAAMFGRTSADSNLIEALEGDA